jgi:hypothetical protein
VRHYRLQLHTFCTQRLRRLDRSAASQNCLSDLLDLTTLVRRAQRPPQRSHELSCSGADPVLVEVVDRSAKDTEKCLLHVAEAGPNGGYGTDIVCSAVPEAVGQSDIALKAV